MSRRALTQRPAQQAAPAGAARARSSRGPARTRRVAASLRRAITLLCVAFIAISTFTAPDPASAAAGDRVSFPWVMQVAPNQSDIWWPVSSSASPGCTDGSEMFNACRTVGYDREEAVRKATIWSFPAPGETGLVIRNDGACLTHATAEGLHRSGDFTQIKAKGSRECNISGSTADLKHSTWYYNGNARTLVAVENGAISAFSFAFENQQGNGYVPPYGGRLTNGTAPMGNPWVFPDARLLPPTPVPTGPDAGKSWLEVSTGVRAPNNSDAHTATATILNSAGVALSGQTVSFRIFDEAGSVLATTAKITPSATTNASGVAQATITATVSGTYTVEATVAGKGITGSKAKRVTFAYQVSQSNSLLEVSNNTRYADEQDYHTVTATIRSTAATGSVGIAGQDVTFTMLTETGGATTDAKVDPITVRTNSAGKAEAKITASKAATYKVQAKVLGSHIEGSLKRTVTFIDKPVDPPVDPPGGVDLSKSVLSVSAGVKPADTQTKHQALAVIKDKNGQAVAWQQVSFKLYDSDWNPATTATIAATGTTSALGIATADITASVGGKYWVEATVGGKEITNSKSVFVTFVDEPPVVSPEQSRLAVTAHKPFADGSSEHLATATILSATGTPIPLQTVKFAVFAETGAATTDAVIQASAVTGVTGEAIAPITATKPGIYMVEATVGGTHIAGSRQRFVEFVEAPIVSMTCPAPESTDGLVKLSGASGPETATKVRVYKRDGSGQAKLWGEATIAGSGAARTWSFTGPEPLATGTYSFTARTVDAAGTESADSTPACPLAVTREVPLTGAKLLEPVATGSDWVAEISANNWEITATEGSNVQVISGGGSAMLTPGKSYAVGERLRTSPAPAASARLYAQRGNVACVGGDGVPLRASVFDAAAGVITLDASGATKVVSPIACSMTNQTANVSFITKRAGGQPEMPADGWKLELSSAEPGFDRTLDSVFTVLDARPGSYELTAVAPAGLTVTGVERLRLSIPGCRALANDPVTARESCWEPADAATRGLTQELPQGSHSVFRVLTAAPLEMPALPLTGGIGSWQFTASGAGVLLLASLGYWLRGRRHSAARVHP